MTKEDRLAVGIGVALAVGLVIAGATGWAPLPGLAVASQTDGAVSGVKWGPGYPAGHEHLLAPWEMDGCLTSGHPLFRRPRAPRCTRDALVEHGWSWISDPPSEEDI
jgi:hypothetical protein